MKKAFKLFSVCFIIKNIIPVFCFCSRKTADLGLFGEKFTKKGALNVKGVHSISAMLMAIREINNKSDGIFDHILPNTQIRFALRETHADYLKASLAAQEFSLKVFNGSGVVGAIGTGYDDASKAVAATFAKTKFHVNNIDYFANGSFLSHSSSFPYFQRVVPSGGFVGRILAQICLHYGWNRVNVFSTSDIYGTDISLEYFLEAEKLGIEIENKHAFWPGTKPGDHHFDEMIQQTMRYGVLKVFVLLMRSEDAGTLLEAGYKKGMFKEGTQILGAPYIMRPEVWNAMSHNAPVAKIMKGIVNVVPILNRNTTVFRSFVERFLNQTNTLNHLANGQVVCSEVTDDDGDTHLYLNDDYMDDGVIKCAGIDYSTLDPSGSDLDDAVAYAYDAVIAMALGLHTVIHEHNNCDFSGDDLREALKSSVNFTGATGYIKFFAGLGGHEAYGSGGREIGLTYLVQNFNPVFFHRFGTDQFQAIRTIGYWTNDDKKWRSCDMQSDDLCTVPSFNTIDGKPVSSTPTIIEVQLDDWVRDLLYAGSSLALVTALFYLFVMILYMDTRLIKASQPGVMMVIIFGILLGCTMVFLKTMDITDELCMTAMWFGHMSFALVFAALLSKTWRLGKIVNSGFLKVKVTKSAVYKLLAGGLAMFVFFLVIDTVVGNPHLAYEHYFDGHHDVRLMKCENDNPYVTMVLFAIEAAVLFYTGKLCYDAKDAPNSVNDSTSTALAIYLIMFVCAVTFPIVFLHIDPTPQNMTVVTCIGLFVAMISISHILFGYKALLALEGADVDANFNIVRANDVASPNLRGLTYNFFNKIQSRASGVSNRVNESIIDASRRVSNSQMSAALMTSARGPLTSARCGLREQQSDMALQSVYTSRFEPGQ